MALFALATEVAGNVGAKSACADYTILREWRLGGSEIGRRQDPIAEGERTYREWRDNFLRDPEKQEIYAEEASKMDLWLQLVEARQAAGITQAELAERLGVSQAQVARLEKRNYASYTLRSLEHYVKALGDDFELEINIRRK